MQWETYIPKIKILNQEISKLLTFKSFEAIMTDQPTNGKDGSLEGYASNKKCLEKKIIIKKIRILLIKS